MPVEEPKQSQDFRTLHRTVARLVEGCNALLNMTGIMEGRASGRGSLRMAGPFAELRINTDKTGGDVSGQNKRHTSVVIASSHNPSDFGEYVFWGAVVAEDATGTIQFYIDGNAWGAPVTIVSGLAISASRNDLSSGTHNIQAHYSGDYQYLDGWSDVFEQVVNELDRPVVQCSAVPNPAEQGIDFVTFLADVTTQNPIPPAPELTGTVRFFIDGSNFSDRPLTFLRQNGDRTKTYRADTSDDPINYLSFGDHEIRAFYLGDNNYRTAQDSVILRIKKSANINLTVTPNPQEPNGIVTIRCTVTGDAITPVGTVHYFIDGVDVFDEELTNGVSEFQLNVGPTERDFTIAAHYDGDDWYMPGNSNTVILHVVNAIVVSNLPSYIVQTIHINGGVDGCVVQFHAHFPSDIHQVYLFIGDGVLGMNGHVTIAWHCDNVAYASFFDNDFPITIGWINVSTENTLGQIFTGSANIAVGPSCSLDYSPFFRIFFKDNPSGGGNVIPFYYNGQRVNFVDIPIVIQFLN